MSSRSEAAPSRRMNVNHGRKATSSKDDVSKNDAAEISLPDEAGYKNSSVTVHEDGLSEESAAKELLPPPSRDSGISSTMASLPSSRGSSSMDWPRRASNTSNPYPQINEHPEDAIRDGRDMTNQDEVDHNVTTKYFKDAEYDILHQSQKRESGDHPVRKKSNSLQMAQSNKDLAGRDKPKQTTQGNYAKQSTSSTTGVTSPIPEEVLEVKVTPRPEDISHKQRSDQKELSEPAADTTQSPDVFDTLPPGPDKRTADILKRKVGVFENLKKTLRLVVFRRGAPWMNSFVMMGLDHDSKFKIWVGRQYEDEMRRVVMDELKKRSMSSPRYTRHLEVVGLDDTSTLQREAGMALLPGLHLNLPNNYNVRLTGFFIAGSDMYALTTSHLQNLTRQTVRYEKQPGQMVQLGKIVCHVCHSSPFREACLVKVNANRVRDVSEFITDASSAHPVRFITSVYTGSVDNIPVYRPHGLMNYGPGQYHPVRAWGIMDINDHGQVLEDAVVWTSSNNDGGPGESGASILGRTQDGNFELLAMYIGHMMLGNQRLLVSHAMKDTLDYFNGQLPANLQVYNVNTVNNLPVIAGVQAVNQFPFNMPAQGQQPTTTFNVSDSRPILRRDMNRKVARFPRVRMLANNKKAMQNDAVDKYFRQKKRDGDKEELRNAELCISNGHTQH